MNKQNSIKSRSQSILLQLTTPGHEACLSVVDIPSNTLLEKNDFPFPSRYRLQTASWLGVVCVLLPFPMRGFCLV